MDKICEVKEKFEFISNYDIARNILSSPEDKFAYEKFGLTEDDLGTTDEVVKSLERDDDVYKDSERGKTNLVAKFFYEDGVLVKDEIYSWSSRLTGQRFFDKDGEFHNEEGPALNFPLMKVAKYFLHGVELRKEKFEEQYISNRAQRNDVADKPSVKF